MLLRTYLCRLAFLFIVIVSIATGSAHAQPEIKGGPATDAGVYRVRAKLSAYCTCKKCCGSYSKKKRTKDGSDALQPTGVAAAMQWVPLGSYVLIPGLPVNELRRVDDTGRNMRRMARRGLLQFDIRFGGANAHRDANRFGVRWTDVYVLLKEPTAVQAGFFIRTASGYWETTAANPADAFLPARGNYAILSD